MPLAIETEPKPLKSVKKLTKLSRREWEIMLKLVHGQTVTGIARELGISVKTVSSHFARIKEKTAVHGIVELTLLAVNEEIVLPSGEAGPTQRAI